MERSNPREGLVVGSIVAIIALALTLLGIWKASELILHLLK